MVRLLLVRRGLKTRIEPISQTEEQRMAQSIASQVQQAMGTVFPGRDRWWRSQWSAVGRQNRHADYGGGISAT